MICNPMDLPYRFQELTVGPFWRAVVREGADPSLIHWRGRYWLFVSMSAGFWHSDDLVDWEFVATPGLSNYDYAPDVRIIDDQMVVCASHPTKTGDFYRTSDPIAGEWEVIPGALKIWDPNLFQDDDGRVYLYWGCSDKTPIQGVELDRASFQPIGDPVQIVHGDNSVHGFERRGPDFDPTKDKRSVFLKPFVSARPFIEGAWMTKHRDRYYLQYSAPGTEMHTYSDGYYTAASPLGPFTYAPNSPFSSRPGGFFPGAGHGSTMQDEHGNWWHVATMRISKHFMFERRIGIFPAGFDDDGVLFTNQEFADYPSRVPDGPADPWSLSAKSMLLNIGTSTTASGCDPEHGPELAVDEDVTTWWVAPDDAPGHWIQSTLPEGSTVESVQVNVAEHGLKPTVRRSRRDTTLTALWQRYINDAEPSTEVLVQLSVDGSDWTTVHDSRATSSSRSHVFVELDEPTQYRFVRVTGFAQPYGGRFAVSGLRVFGRGNGSAPAATTSRARRTGPLNALVEWDAVPGVQGYNLRYGIAADKLYSSWQFDARTSHDLGALNAGVDYWVAVDSYNENGVTRGNPVPVR
ncbi:family 43 glycosylhydrolase [Curtobacterium pusillum]|uniref:family 43 glycosylhydrolase n=1 Tax=Curtobacterium pusillum TaxID=69373 RepID=UPI0037FBFF13